MYLIVSLPIQHLGCLTLPFLAMNLPLLTYMPYILMRILARLSLGLHLLIESYRDQ